MQPTTPCLWLDHQAEEAARFYVDAITRTSSRSSPAPSTPRGSWSGAPDPRQRGRRIPAGRGWLSSIL